MPPEPPLVIGMVGRLAKELHGEMVQNLDVRLVSKEALYPAIIERLQRMHKTLKEFREHQVITWRGESEV